MKIKKYVALVLALLLIPTFALADDMSRVEGTIQGFACVLQGKTCPPGLEDVIAALEKNFVVLTKDGKYYTIPNMDQNVLARNLSKFVRISGRVDVETKRIIADKLEVKSKGAWKVTWSQKMEIEGRKFLEMGP